jgi:amino acid adenylation domain-containing protein
MLLEGMAADPTQRISVLPLLTPPERHTLVQAWNATATEYPRDRCIHELFAEQARRTPDAVALVCGEQRLGYGELNARANQLAHHLLALGVGPDAPVGVYLERSVEMVTAVLAVLKAGGAYLPLDPAYPRERIRFMLQDAAAPVAITCEAWLEHLAGCATRVVGLERAQADIERLPVEDPANRTRPDQLANIIYTSGSTGAPKGVEVPHRGVTRLVFGCDYAHFGPDEVFLQLAPMSFDASTFELWGALLHGATCVLFPERIPSTSLLAEVIAKHGVTTLWLTSSLFNAIIDEAPQTLTGIRQLLTGGEALSLAHVRRALELLPATQLINGYGPTESTTFTCCYAIPRSLDPNLGSVPIGRPLGNTRVYLLDAHRQPVPSGVAGELYIGGDGLARGYRRRPELTAERFVPDPFSAEPAARLYRTGDLARWLADGNLEFLGRIDQQVKIRGFRIEPGEIEAVLERHERVRAALVVAHRERLVAYVVFGAGGAVEESDLRRHAAEVLPEYMVPSVYVQLEALPLTPNGKVDRQALPEPVVKRLEAGEAEEGPRTQLEETLAGIWNALLGLESIGRQDNFFALGGHSLLATRVMSRVGAAFGVELSVRVLFDNPTIAGLAAAVDAAAGARTALPSRLAEAGGRERAASPTAALVFPASFAQQRLWFLDQLNPGQTVYSIEHAIHITGLLDAAVLERAINEIIRRHESLRTTIAIRDGEPVQVVAQALNLSLPVIDISGEPPELREARAQTLASELARQPFDLARGPLLRLRLLRLSAQDHILAIPIHHSVADGWSLDILQNELAALYAAFAQGEPSPLAELPIQYADFTLWQRQQLQRPELQRQLDYWKQQLNDLTPLDLPIDRPLTSTPSVRGAQCRKVLSLELSDALRELSTREGATLFMTMLAAFQVLLHRHCGQDDITVGSPVAGRVHPDIESLIGLFLNNLVLRTDLSGNPSFCELLARVKAMALGAYAHQDVPFERLVEELRPPRDMGRNPLFDVMINFLPGARVTTLRGGLCYRSIDLEETTAKFALTLYMSEADNGCLEFCLVYQTDLFDAASIECMMDQLSELLQQLADAPELPIDAHSRVTPGAPSWLPDPAAPLPEPIQEPVTAMFLRWAERAPTQTALWQSGRQWTYGELAASAQSLASSLVTRGVGKGDVIGISGDRSFGLVAAMLAVLLAGGVMLPIDRLLPRRRRRTMLQTADARWMLWIGDPGCAEPKEYQQGGLPTYCLDAASGRPLEKPVADAALLLPQPMPDDPAYVFFTSGTTGVPKGVLGCHKGISHFINWQRETFAIGPRDRVAQLTSLSFDVLLRDLFLPLTSGATLSLPEESDLPEVPEWLAHAEVTVLHTVPTLLQAWLSSAAPEISLPALHWVFIAGEPLTGALVQQWRRTFPGPGRLVNLYGPTETTLAKCYYLVPDHPGSGVQPAGLPLPQTQVLILRASGRLCGAGEPGEIVVRTPYRTLGYLNPDAQARPGFTPNPFRDDAGDLFYHTGDRGRYRPDGLLEISGRLDDQVKIRGVRIEPAEISAVLSGHPEVRACVVVAAGDPSASEQRTLAAYVAPAAPNAVDAKALSTYLRERLPAAMVPANFTFLEALPTTSSGKIDRRALPPLEPCTWAVTGPMVPPRTALERALAQIWCDVLQRAEIGIHDDFFALGGHSLLVTQVVGRVRKQLRIDLPLRLFFEAPTIALLAALIEPLQPATEQAILPRIPCIPRDCGGSRRATGVGTDKTKTGKTAT